MEALELKKYLDASPFRPIKFVTTRHGSFDLESNLNLLLTETALYIGEGANENGIPKSARQVALAQVTRVEPL